MINTYKVEGMKCQGCADNIEKAFKTIPSVEKIEFNLDDKTVTVTGDVTIKNLQDSLSDTEYKLSV